MEGQCEGGGWSCHAHSIHGTLAFSPQGHLTLPEGPNPEEGHALRHGQLECADSSRLTSGASRGPLLLYQLPGLCSFWLLPKGHMVWYPAQGYTHYTKAGQARGLFIAFLCLLLSQTWDQSPTYRRNQKSKSPTSCVHSYLSFKILDSLSQGLCVCVCV